MSAELLAFCIENNITGTFKKYLQGLEKLFETVAKETNIKENMIDWIEKNYDSYMRGLNI